MQLKPCLYFNDNLDIDGDMEIELYSNVDITYTYTYINKEKAIELINHLKKVFEIE